MLICNPLTWFRRLRHRHGYGIHSPFAYGLVTQVLCNSGTYYAYSWLTKLHPWHVRRLCRHSLAVHRLLFRLANHFQPGLISVPDGLTDALWNYLHEGCRHALIDPAMPRGAADMLVLAREPQEDWQPHVSDHSLLVVLRLSRNAHLWQQVKQDPKTRVTFDFCDVGLALFDPRLQRQDYLL